MKDLKIKFGIFNLLIIFAVSIFLTACEQADVLEKNNMSEIENQRITDALCDHSHDCDIEITGNDISVEDCSNINREDFLNYLDMLENGYEQTPIVSNVPHPLNPGEMLEIPIQDVKYYDEDNHPKIEDRQRLRSILRFVKNSKVSNIKYFIRSSVGDDCKSGWVDGINDAADYWNNISGSKVKLTPTNVQQYADIIIGCNTDPIFDGTTKETVTGTAKADYPNSTYRTPGPRISIKSTSNSVRKRGIMIHEFGHTLGLAHTDDAAKWHIPFSSVTNSNSIMNATVRDNAMSTQDKKAVRRIWPDWLSKPSNVSFQKIGGSVRIKFRNSQFSSRPYNHINVGHWYNGSYQPWGNWGHPADGSGNYDIWWIQYFPPGRHWFYVQGASHVNEVLSTYSGWYYVDM